MAFKLLETESTPIGQSCGVLYALNQALYDMRDNEFASIVRDSLLVQFPAFERSVAKSGFFVPLFKNLDICVTEYKNIVLREIREEYNSLAPVSNTNRAVALSLFKQSPL